MKTTIALAAFLSLVSCAPRAANQEVAEATPAPPAYAPADRAVDQPAELPELVPNQRQPYPDVVSGGQPTPEQLAAAAEAGYKTVINLRRPGESGVEGASDVTDLGLAYVALPIAGADGLTEQNARTLAGLLDAAERPVLVHCGSGNRVGALFALKAFYLDGATAQEALDIGLANGLTGLEDAVRERLGL